MGKHSDTLFFTMSHQLSIRFRVRLRLKKQVKAEAEVKEKAFLNLNLNLNLSFLNLFSLNLNLSYLATPAAVPEKVLLVVFIPPAAAPLIWTEPV